MEEKWRENLFARMHGPETTKHCEVEFEDMVNGYLRVEDRVHDYKGHMREETGALINLNVGLNFEELMSHTIHVLDINDMNLELNEMISGLKVIRKLVEMQNEDKVTAAWEWLPHEWTEWRIPIEEMQGTLVSLGVCRILLRLVALHEEATVRYEAVQALCTMLLGGHRQVQDDVYESLRSPLGGSTLGLSVCRSFGVMCEQARTALRKSTVGMATKTSVIECVPMLRVLQLMTDFSHEGIQDFLRDQHSPSSTNVIAEVASLLNILVEGRQVGINKESGNIRVAIQTVITLTEFVTGPCVANQNCMVPAKVIISCNDIIRWTEDEIREAGFRGGDNDTQVQYLKQLTVDLLNELIVGSPEVVMIRLKTILDPAALLRRMTWLYQEFLGLYADELGAQLVPLTKPVEAKRHAANTREIFPHCKEEEEESAVGEYSHSVFGGQIDLVWSVPRARLRYLPAQAFAGEEGFRGGGMVQEGFGIFQLLMLVGEHFNTKLVDIKTMINAEEEAYRFYDNQTARIARLEACHS